MFIIWLKLRRMRIEETFIDYIEKKRLRWFDVYVKRMKKERWSRKIFTLKSTHRRKRDNVEEKENETKIDK